MLKEQPEGQDATGSDAKDAYAHQLKYIISRINYPDLRDAIHCAFCLVCTLVWVDFNVGLSRLRESGPHVTRQERIIKIFS